MKTLILGASLRRGRRLIHPGRYFVPSKSMDEATAADAVKRGIAAWAAPCEAAPPPAPPPADPPASEPAAETPEKRRRGKGPAPENKALGNADDTGETLV